MTRRDYNLIAAANIERLMEINGFNGVTLAEAAGLSRTSVYAVIKRDIASPRLSTLTKIADALNVTVHELLTQGNDGQLGEEIANLVAAIPNEQRLRVRDMLLGIVRTLPKS